MTAAPGDSGNGIVVRFVGETGTSAPVAELFFPAINYDFSIDYNPIADEGLLTGSHDGFPSYIVQRNSEVICDFQQGVIFELIGDSDVEVNKEF